MQRSFKWKLMAVVCASASLPACAQQPEPAPAGVHATPETPVEGVRSWRRVFPTGEEGDRLRDLLGVLNEGDDHTPLLSDAFYAHTPRERLDTILQEVRASAGGDLGFVRVLRTSENALGVELQDGQGVPWTLAFQIDDAGRVTALDIKQQLARPEGAKVYDTWGEVLDDVRALGGDASVSVRRLGETGLDTPIALHDADRVMNIGQVAQLFTFGALAEAVRAGELSWDDEVEMRTLFRSLPPSQFSIINNGARYPITDYLASAGALRDTHAADALLHTVGRDRVVAYYESLVEAPPSFALPWLSMRDFALLKLFSSQEGRERYAGDDAAVRLATLARVPDDADLTIDQDERLALWRTPRSIDRIGWFASADDLVITLADLRERAADPEMLPLSNALLAKSTGTLVQEVWHASVIKAGGEPGVFAGAWMMRRYDGAWFSSVLIVNDTETMADGDEASRILKGVADLLLLED